MKKKGNIGKKIAQEAMKIRDKPVKESMTTFERQEEAWFDNDCQGNISDEQYWDA